MKAVIVNAYGDASELHYGEAEQPQLGSGEVLVRLQATSINPLDWKMRFGAAKKEFPMHFPEILGEDVSGELERLESSVVGFLKRMRVMGKGKGTYAQFVAHERRLHDEAIARLKSEHQRLSARLEVLYDDKLDGRIDIPFTIARQWTSAPNSQRCFS